MLHAKSILIVEDDCVLAFDLALEVEKMGGRVIGPAETVADALTLLDLAQPCGAVLDCQLIDRDVGPVLERLVRDGVPLVIHSGTGLPPNLAAAHPNLPVTMKPLKPEIVLELLARQIAAVQSASGSATQAD